MNEDIIKIRNRVLPLVISFIKCRGDTFKVKGDKLDWKIYYGEQKDFMETPYIQKINTMIFKIRDEIIKILVGLRE